MTPEQLAEVREALAKATPGPWRVETNNLGRSVYAGERDQIATYYEPRWGPPGRGEAETAARAAITAEGLANETLAILLRNLAPALLDHVEEQRKEIERLHEIAAGCREHLEWHGIALGEEASWDFPPPRWSAFETWQRCDAERRLLEERARTRGGGA